MTTCRLTFDDRHGERRVVECFTRAVPSRLEALTRIGATLRTLSPCPDSPYAPDRAIGDTFTVGEQSWQVVELSENGHRSIPV